MSQIASEPLPFPASRDHVGRHDGDELARRNHFSFLPEFRKMPLVAGHQVVGARGVGAFQGFFAYPRKNHHSRIKQPEPLDLRAGQSVRG